MTCAQSLPQVLVEECGRPFPSELRRLGVVPRRRVVVESVLRSWVEEPLVLDLCRLERLLVVRPARVDPLIVLGRLDHQRGLDLGYILQVRRGPVESHAGGKIVSKSRGQVT